MELLESESVFIEPEPRYSAELCPRTINIVELMDPIFLSCFFTQSFPNEAKQRSAPDDPAYWQAVYNVLNAIPRTLRVESKSLKSFREIFEDESIDKRLRAYVNEHPGRDLLIFLLCYFNPPYDHFNAPYEVQSSLVSLFASNHAEFEADLNLSQQALNNVLFSLAEYEILETVHLLREKLLMPSHHLEVSKCVLLMGALVTRAWRKDVYETLPPHVRPLSFGEFNEKTLVIREQGCSAPLLVALLKQLPPRYPDFDFERIFIQAIYPEGDVPEDVGRQALVFSSRCVPQRPGVLTPGLQCPYSRVDHDGVGPLIHYSQAPRAIGAHEVEYSQARV